MTTKVAGLLRMETSKGPKVVNPPPTQGQKNATALIETVRFSEFLQERGKGGKGGQKGIFLFFRNQKNPFFPFSPFLFHLPLARCEPECVSPWRVFSWGTLLRPRRLWLRPFSGRP